MLRSTCAASDLVRGTRGLCAPAASALAAVRARAAAAWDALLDAEWVDDEPSNGALVERAGAVVDEYRALYREEDVAAGGEAREVYDEVARVYQAGEAARLTETYADHMSFIVREHMAMTGGLGNDTELKPEAEALARETLDEYVQFVNSIENVRIRRKTEAQLGRKAIQVRQVLSVESFGDKFYPIATDHMVTTRVQPRLSKEDG